MELRIVHLYYNLMNIYGDDGNIICLKKRALWRGIKPIVKRISIGDEIDSSWGDIYFLGGGQDRQQIIVSKDLEGENGEKLKEAKEKGAVFFSICGGYQLLGHYYKPHNGPEIKGLGILDVYTIAGEKRLIQNIIVKINPSLNIKGKFNTLVGFENHSGKTYLLEKAKPLGKVIVGGGNNSEDKTEGAFEGNAFGCYLHGACLPKNPHFADFLISRALSRRYGKVSLKPLDDALEWKTHENILKRFGKGKIK
jgi:CobQ-like glutamine amidotransferase family enzyme